MKKKVIIISVAIILLVLLFPIRNQLKDGGTVNGIYELGESAWNKKAEGLDYNLRVINLTKDGKIEVEVTK